MKAARHHSDHFIRTDVELHSFAYYAWIASEYAWPQRIAQHQGSRRSVALVLSREVAPECGLRSDHREQLRTGHRSFEPQRFSLSNEVGRQTAIRRHGLERFAHCLPVTIVRRRQFH